MSNHIEIELSQTQIIFTRIVAFNFIFLLPILILFTEWVIFFFWNDRKYLSNRLADKCHKYNKIIHSIAFGLAILFFFSVVGLIIFFNVYTNRDNWWKNNQYIWKFNPSISKNIFLGWVNFGFIIYLLDTLFYLNYNIRKTHSYFAVYYQKYKQNKVGYQNSNPNQ
ncbi:magnesium-transporting ATPase (P-type) [Mycoplasmoides fastidiosum]|uniref:Magnesium-transporting ATPase (P-type) n=1 Tax=Mycoplasmoides fastidiosum TaxID=92758 RepID=A0ABU0LZU7_9BACT|nr:hypothetical protein [Mycoplasmoides fastidiosum]MDQ0514224.1 magnesium-transporting ATPase (P-type) [Mycoplasmoides fastidiosum]UUD37368.1 hypothetical protein NPA10_02170 [Mycoplasmoides fastidiosum]